MSAMVMLFVPRFRQMRSDSDRDEALRACESVAEALVEYESRFGAFPPGPQGNPEYNYDSGVRGGAALLNKWLVESAHPVLHEAVGVDPWGKPYAFHVFTLDEPFHDVVVFSHGPDGVNSSWNAALWNRGIFGGDDLGVVRNRQ